MPGRSAPRTRVAQAWIEPVSDDPGAASALAVSRAHLAAGRRLQGVRRLRLFELRGPLPARARLAELLHRSIQFYNPHKERCVVRAAAAGGAPIAPGEHAVLVFDRGEERRSGAERWWRHETGRDVEVREGVVWALSFEPGEADPAGAAADLALVRDRRHGLLCNPHAQEYRLASGTVPLPWLDA